MGKETKDNLKKLLGKNDILGHDIAVFSQSVASGIAGATSLTTLGGGTYVNLPRGGVLQFITSDVGRQLTAGQLNTQVKLNGTVIASGSHTTGNGAVQEWVFGHNQNFPKRTLTSGDYLEAEYSVNDIISLGATAQGCVVKVGMQYLE